MWDALRPAPDTRARGVSSPPPDDHRRSEAQATSKGRRPPALPRRTPVKSLRAVRCSHRAVDGVRGLAGDRTLMLVRAPEHGGRPRFLTQRQCPALATLSATLVGDVATLSCDDGRRAVTVPLDPAAVAAYDRTEAELWDAVARVADVGDAAARFVADAVRRAADDDGARTAAGARVVCFLPGAELPVDRWYLPVEALVPAPPLAGVLRHGTGAFVPRTVLNDGFPVLIASEASLADLNRRIERRGGKAVPMARFRPNIVVSGPALEAFEEDGWRTIAIGDSAIFHLVKGCPRCIMSCTDQTDGERGQEPLATLKEFRSGGDGANVYFAINAVPAGGAAEIKVGDPVRVLRRGATVWDVRDVAAE